jgi:Prephenate dehydratase
VPCPTFEDCFTALIAGDVDLGMIPIENSVAGRVADIHHLMPTAGLHIIAEWFLPIRNQLLAPKGASLKTIKTVQSHVMALGQCRNVIRELRLRPVVAADTAGSAREVAEATGSDPGGDRFTAGGGNLWPRHSERKCRGRVTFHHALRRAVA